MAELEKLGGCSPFCLVRADKNILLLRRYPYSVERSPGLRGSDRHTKSHRIGQSISGPAVEDQLPRHQDEQAKPTDSQRSLFEKAPFRQPLQPSDSHQHLLADPTS